MSDTPTFAEIHGKKPESIKRPPPFPFGWYIAVVDGQPVKGETRTAKIEQWTVKAKLLQPQNIDQDKLIAWKQATGESVLGQSIYLYFNASAPWRLTEFLTHLGLGNVEYPQCMAECPGRQFLVEIGHTTSLDGKHMVHEVRSTAKLPE